jgi:hypothetical protein
VHGFTLVKNAIQKEAPCSLFYQGAKEILVSILNIYRHLVGLGDACDCNETAKAMKLPLENRHYPESGLSNGWWAVTGSWEIGFGGRSKMGQPRRRYSEDYKPATIRLITKKSGTSVEVVR